MIRYEHPLGKADAFDWLNPNQFLFVDGDKSLNVYDRRNESVTRLLEGITQFKLSPDKKTIAFIRNDDTVYAGQLQGNNVLNEKAIYKGFIPSDLIWSQDHENLLITGWKPYNREPQPAPMQLPERGTPSRPSQAMPLVSSYILEFARN